MTRQEDVQITVQDLIEIIAGNYTIDGKPIKDFCRTKYDYIQHFLTREAPAFDIDSHFDEWVKTSSRHPWRYIIKKFPGEIEEMKRIVVLLLPAKKMRDASGCQDEPQYRYGYELPLLLVNEELTDMISTRLSNVLPAIVQLQNLSCLKDRSYEFAFLFLVYTHLFHTECLFADNGISSILTHRSLEGCGLSNEKLQKLQSMTVEQRIELERKLGIPTFKIENILSSWDTFGQRLAAEQLRSVDATRGILVYSMIPPTFIPFDRIRTGLEAMGEPFEEPLVKVPLDVARLAEEGGSLQEEGTATPLVGKELVPGKDTSDGQTHEYEISVDGDFMVITFRGDRLQSMNSRLKGIPFILHLLEHPHVDFPVLDFDTTVNPRPVVETIDELPKKLQRLEAEGFSRVAALVEGDIINTGKNKDKKYNEQRLRAYFKQAEDRVDKELQDARANGNTEQEEQAEKVATFLKKQRNYYFDKYGRLRPEPGDVDKTRKRIYKNIADTRRHIERFSPALAQHLKYIRYRDAEFSYRPPEDENIEWHIFRDNRT